jgi:hypothetical protein
MQTLEEEEERNEGIAFKKEKRKEDEQRRRKTSRGKEGRRKSKTEPSSSTFGLEEEIFELDSMGEEEAKEGRERSEEEEKEGAEKGAIVALPQLSRPMNGQPLLQLEPEEDKQEEEDRKRKRSRKEEREEEGDKRQGDREEGEEEEGDTSVSTLGKVKNSLSSSLQNLRMLPRMDSTWDAKAVMSETNQEMRRKMGGQLYGHVSPLRRPARRPGGG